MSEITLKDAGRARVPYTKKSGKVFVAMEQGISTEYNFTSTGEYLDIPKELNDATTEVPLY